MVVVAILVAFHHVVVVVRSIVVAHVVGLSIGLDLLRLHRRGL